MVKDETKATNVEESPAAEPTPEPAATPVPYQAPVLMVEVENITHDKFRQSEEMKVRTFSNNKTKTHFNPLHQNINFFIKRLRMS